MATIQLTESQRLAAGGFRTFLGGSGQVFMLNGAAGTGKTTLLMEFLKILEAESRPVRLMAPTGRAAHIIGSKTGVSACTIHRGIYALANLKSTSQNKEDEDDGGLHAKFGLRTNEDSLNAVYIVDEASMVSDAFSENEAFSFGSGKLLTDLFEYAKGRKIVFVGDYAQLPPIGMKFSPALDKGYVEATFNCKVVDYTLREVMRQSQGSVMLANATKVRDSIERKSFVEFSLDAGTDSIAENECLLRPYFLLSESKPSVKAAVIAYSNRQALQYNLTIRQHYFGVNAPRLQVGDLLMIARNNYAYEEELFNGNIVQVEACTADSEVEARHVRVKLGKDRVESVELRFRRATIRFGVGGKAVSFNVTLLDNFLDDPSGAVGGLLARALVVDFENRLPHNIKSRLSEIKRALRDKGNLPPELEQLRDAYLNLMRTDSYYNAVICKYGYAMTCHKAQGGEWENVFVDMCRFGGTANEDYFRWAYTALTRASKCLWHYHSPDFNYISGMIVEPIQQSAKLKVSLYADGEDFRDSRFNRIRALCDNADINVAEDKSTPFQHRLVFTRSNGECAAYNLWYNTIGYSDKNVLQHSSSDDFAAFCLNIINDSFAPESVPFFSPLRPFAEKLANFLKSQFDELGIRLLNITQEQFQDVYHLKTDGIAKVSISYTDKGNYTYMRLQSTLGQADKKLEALRQRFT